MNESPGTHLCSILHSILDISYKRELQFAKNFNYHHQVIVWGIPKRSVHASIYHKYFIMEHFIMKLHQRHFPFLKIKIIRNEELDNIKPYLQNSYELNCSYLCKMMFYGSIALEILRYSIFIFQVPILDFESKYKLVLNVYIHP